MFTTDTKAVTLFTSQDDGAPKLTASAGSLKTLLKACLVTGFNGKQGLGWTMPFEETNAAVFRSQAIDSNQFYFKITQAQPRFAIIEGFRNMTSLKDGTGYFGYDGDYKRFGFVESSDQSQQNWWLCGHDKAFILLIANRDKAFSMCLFFGDVPTLAAADTGNTVLWHNHQSVNWTYFSSGDLYFNGGSERRYQVPVFAKTYSGNETAAFGFFASFASQSNGLIYPDKITGGLIATEIYLYEWGQTGSALRSEQPALLRCLHNLNDFAEGADVGVLDGDDGRYLKFCLSGSRNGSQQYLLNTTRWRV